MNIASRNRNRALLLPLLIALLGNWVGCGDNEPQASSRSKRATGGTTAASSGGHTEAGVATIAGTDAGGVGGDELVGAAGATEAKTAGAAGAVGTLGVAGSAGAPSDTCPEPPAPTPLVGWAAVAGNGIETTTGGGDATPVVVSNFTELALHVAGVAPGVVHVTGVMAPGELLVGSNKTIVGLCGAELHGHVHLSGSTNVILRNIKVVGYGVGNCALDPDFDATVGCSSGHDAISVLNNAHHIYVDHCDISDGTDGNLDISNGSDFVTVSYTKFHYTPRTDLA